jgi:hypothetical protein
MNWKSYFKNLAIALGLVLLLATVLALIAFSFVIEANAATTSSAKHNNGIGFLMYQDNPNQYLMGTVSKVDMGTTRANRNVIVFEVRPTNTYSMFSQSLAFCNITEEQLSVLRENPVVVFTYSRVMHHAECFDLYRVDKVGK